MNPPGEKNWFARNWMWLLPSGCLSIVAVVVLFGVAIVALVFGILKSSGPYEAAVAEAKSSPAVQEALGTPIREGWYVLGNLRYNNSSGDLDLTIPISGPNGKGTIYLVGQRTAGEWHYSTFVVKIHATGDRINLLPTEE